MNSSPLTPPGQPFAGVPVCPHLDELTADIAIVGLHYVSPYPQASAGTAKDRAPDAIRSQSKRFIDHLHNYDFDFDEILLPSHLIQVVDCGDIDTADPVRITSVIKTILEKGAVPLVMGTDEGGFIPYARAFDRFDDLCVIHLDAHIDWKYERYGVTEGYSSGMRRASEMPWVNAMVQIGLRGIGSAGRQEINDALAFGSIFIRAREMHRYGVEACLDRIPAACHYLITLDADALDLAIAPGVLFPSPGGLRFDQVTDLVRGISSKGRIVGISLFEVRPEKDVYGLTASTAAQLMVHFMGILSRRFSLER